MILKSFKMKLVSKDFILRIFLNLFLGLHLFVSRLKFFVNVASVVATGLAAVFRPFSKTEPAKSMRTLRADYVIASLIFLDQCVALGTRFRIGFEPLNVFWIAFLLLEPEFNLITWCWSMVLLHAFETESVSTGAVNWIRILELWPLNNKIATFGRTPSKVLVLIGELFAVPRQILLLIINSILLFFFVF